MTLLTALTKKDGKWLSVKIVKLAISVVLSMSVSGNFQICKDA